MTNADRLPAPSLCQLVFVHHVRVKQTAARVACTTVASYSGYALVTLFEGYTSFASLPVCSIICPRKQCERSAVAL